MKPKLFLLLVFLNLIFTSFAYKSKNDVSNTDPIKLVFDKNKSTVSWRGYEVVKSNLSSHYGVAKVSEGEVSINPVTQSIVAGRAVVDMTSFESFDLNKKSSLKAKLDGHLKGNNFLDVERFPTAIFQVTGHKKLDKKKYNAQITGNLTLKGVTKNISFKAMVIGDLNKIELTSEEFDINRQNWGVVLKDYGETLTKDVVTMQIKLTANQIK